MKYRVHTAFRGVFRPSDGTSEFVTLETGSVLTIRGQERNGMVTVMYQARLIAVFVKDLEDLTVRIK
jgi:hypothetical protein